MKIITKIKIYLLNRKVAQIESRLRKGLLMKDWAILEQKRNLLIKEIKFYDKTGNTL